MEKIDAVVIEENDNHFIKILDQDPIKILISDDDPKQVKSAFNKLLLRLKQGVFEIELKEESEDLFFQVAKEYLKQLNGELQEVYEEMESAGLLKSGDGNHIKL